MAGIVCRIETDAQRMSLRNFVETQRADLIETQNESAVAIAERYRRTSVTRGYTDKRGPYEGCRGVWRMSLKRAEQADLVLPVMEGIVIGVYRPERWLQATVAHFPMHVPEDAAGRIGFLGRDASPDIVALYKGKRLPEALGTATQNPVRYTY